MGGREGLWKHHGEVGGGEGGEEVVCGCKEDLFSLKSFVDLLSQD